MLEILITETTQMSLQINLQYSRVLHQCSTAHRFVAIFESFCKEMSYNMPGGQNV